MAKIFSPLKISLVLALVFLPSFAGRSDGKMAINDFDFSGDFVLNGKVDMEGVWDIPYHAAFYSKCHFTGEILPDVRARFTLFPQNKSFSMKYYEDAELDFRLFIEYSKTNGDKSKETIIRLGDMERVTVGNGLTFDEMDFDGLSFKHLSEKASLSFIVLPITFTGIENTIVLRAEHPKGFAGFSFIGTVFTAGQQSSPLYKTIQPLVSLDTRIPFLKYCSLYAETAVLDNIGYNFPDCKGFAGLGGVSFDYDKDEKQKIRIKCEVRNYDGDFNRLYAENLTQIYHGQDTEDKKMNNWRNYLMLFGDLTGHAVACFFKREIAHNVDFILDAEYLDIIGAYTVDFFFYDIGFVFRDFRKGADLRVSWCNKLIASDTNWLENTEFMFRENDYIKLQMRLRF